MTARLAGLISVAAITVTYYVCMRPYLSRRGRAGSGRSPQDADIDARHAAAPRRPGLRLLIGVAAAIAVVAVGSHCEPNLSGFRASDTPHALLSPLDSEFTVNAEHAHRVDGSSTACHESMTTAVLPRSGTASVARGAVVTAVAITGSLAQPPVVAGRGPPPARGTALTGQDLLTRFCRARR